jgi:hypothetical protein
MGPAGQGGQVVETPPTQAVRLLPALAVGLELINGGEELPRPADLSGRLLRRSHQLDLGWLGLRQRQ